MEVLGKGVKLKFHMKPLSSLQNIAITDIGPMLHICGHEYMRKHFSSRSDVVIVDRLDGKELRYPSALVYRQDNKKASALVQDLVGGLKSSRIGNSNTVGPRVLARP